MYIGICACVDESIRTVSHNYTFFGINPGRPATRLVVLVKLLYRVIYCAGENYLWGSTSKQFVVETPGTLYFELLW